jgi:hypothetical protein
MKEVCVTQFSIMIYDKIAINDRVHVQCIVHYARASQIRTSLPTFQFVPDPDPDPTL